jgi:hypothetical protein
LPVRSSCSVTLASYAYVTIITTLPAAISSGRPDEGANGKNSANIAIRYRPAILACVLMGAAAGLTWVSGYTLLQQRVANEFRGRTFATLTAAARTALLLSRVAFPALAALLGTRAVTLGRVRVDLSGTRVAMGLAAIMVLLGAARSAHALREHRA